MTSESAVLLWLGYGLTPACGPTQGVITVLAAICTYTG